MEDKNEDVYLDSPSTQMEQDSWLIDSKASFYMTPHSHWFCDYEELKSGDVLLGDNSPKWIVGREKV